ncbi:MAG: FkbM family methyltransferase [Planctomycetes bacterium]|nr:FkbM family methyltransferase [Planctomycetota bacterium]
MSNRLTVIIPCKDEREHIRACILSAQQVADEVLVADSGSTDGTLETAREFGCRIIEREYRTSGDFKNWAIPQAAHEWVLILDADERVTPALADEIRAVLAAPQHDGYWIYRRNHFLGHPIRFGPWSNDRCLRLFRRDLGRYVGPTDHAEVELSSGTVGRLRERMTHYTCASYAQYLPKLSRYADVQSQIWLAEGRRTHWGQLLFRFPLRFFQGYVLRLGVLDGTAGLQVCALVAYMSWLKHSYLWQLQNARDWRELECSSLQVTGEPPGPAIASAPSRQDEPSGSLSISTTSDADKTQRRTLRALRHRWTPHWLRTDARRHWRNVAFRHIGIQRCHTPPIITREPALTVRSCLPFVLSHELLQNPRLTFMQIGAFDGAQDDDLRELVEKHKLRGVLVEPQPAAFARLERTYRDQPQVTLLRAAIAEQEGTRALFCKRGEASMVASFDREHLRRHNVPDHEIVTQQVACHTVESALRAAGLSHINLLQIDAEGYDWPIIRSIDFSQLRPHILRFEYRHMRAVDADACLSQLADLGYRFVVESRDIIAHLDATRAQSRLQFDRRASA